MTPIWTATMSDQLTPVANKLASTMDKLDARANSLFKDSKGNFTKLRKDLMDVGHSAMDAALMTNKYRTALVAARKDALGFTDSIGKASPEMRKFANAWAQIGTAMAKAQIRAPAMQAPSWLSRAGGAIGRGASQVGVGALRKVGDAAMGGALALPGIVADKALDAAKSLSEAVWHAATFRQNTLMGLEYMLKSKKEAHEVFEYAQRLAIDSPMQTEEVIKTYKGFIMAHYGKGESKVLTKLVADVRSRNLEAPEIADHAAFVISHILSSGRATQRHMTMLQAGGFNQLDILKSLSKMENVQPFMKGLKKNASDMELSIYMRKLMTQNKIGPRTLVQAVANAENERSGMAIGAFAKQKGTETLTGVASTLKSAFWDLLEGDAADLANSAGMQALMNFMKRLVDAVSPFSDRFKESGSVILDTVKGITDALFEGLNEISTSDIESFIRRVGELGKEAVSFIKEAWTWFDRFLHADTAADALDDLKQMLQDLGAEIGVGILKGMKTGVVEGAKAALGVGQAEYRNKYKQSHEQLNILASENGMSLKKFLPRYESALAMATADDKLPFDMSTIQAGRAVMMYAGLRNTQMANIERAASEKFDTGVTPGMPRLDTIPSIPKMAAGGFVNRPTLAWIGEAGPEAVVPLDRGSSAMRGGLGRGASLHIGEINVNGMSGGDPAAIGNAVAMCVRREVTNLLERSALEG